MKPSDLQKLGFGRAQARTPGLLIPIHGVDGKIALNQLRPNSPRSLRGKVVKYETPKGARLAIDIHPRIRNWLKDPTRYLVITEGSRKVDAAVSRGLCCIGLLGVWGWRGTNEKGGKAVLSDWESIPLASRHVNVVFDSDVVRKKEVRAALTRLKSFLESRGAVVNILQLPEGKNGEKVGLDDFFASGGTVEDLFTLAAPMESENSNEGFISKNEYRAENGCLVYLKPTREGPVPIGLTNFTARIVTEILIDDGLEIRREYEIEAIMESKVHRFRIPSGQFSGMNWPVEKLGPAAIVSAGFGLRDHARAAIQSVSTEIDRRRIFLHTGWRKIAGIWMFLHAGGAIGPKGQSSSLGVELGGRFDHYRLPEPPDREHLQRVGRTVLDLLDLAPDRVTVPGLGAVFRSVLNQIDGTDFSLHLAGQTGVFKTEFAAILQGFFGAGFKRENLPGAWKSTANSLERSSFLLKDVIFVVDDFAPGGALYQVSKLHREADNLLRGAGNRAGRGRLRSDCTSRPEYYPRGLIVSTGEDVPRGASLGARMLILELKEGDIQPTRLSTAQRLRDDGTLAAVMAGFLQYLASRLNKVHEILPKWQNKIRGRIHRDTFHARTPGILASIASGWQLFLVFAQSRGFIQKHEAEAIRKRIWQALKETAGDQVQHQVACDPVQRFVDLLISILSNGRAHLATPDGNEPDDGEWWGWRGDPSDRRPQGERIGWIEDENVFLLSDAAYAAVQHLARDQGDEIGVSQRTLHKRLRDRGLLVTTDSRRGTLTPRRTIGGVRRAVLHLSAHVISPEPAQPDQPAQIPLDVAETGAGRGQDMVRFGDEPDHETCPEPSAKPGSPGPPGQDGQIGQVAGTINGPKGDECNPDRRNTDGDPFLGEERAAILQFEAGYSKDEAETKAGIRKQAEDLVENKSRESGS
jgi:hypothetical protein